MATITIEYDNNNVVFNGILKAVTKMPDVKIVKTFVPDKTRIKAKVETQRMSTEELYRLAEKIDKSINPNAPEMTMEEIVKEVRDYRNGK